VKTVGEQSIGSQDTSSLHGKWLDAFCAAMNVSRLYRQEHPKVVESLEALLELTRIIQEENEGELALSFAEHTVAINQEEMDPRVLAHRRLAGELHQRNAHTLIFARGINREELSTFMKIFGDHPKNIIKQGGLALLMESAGTHHVRLAALRYASRVDYSEQLKDTEDRILFARVEECLEDEIELKKILEGMDDPSLQLVAFFENPRTTVRFLEHRKGEGESSETFEREVVRTLERAGTIIFTHHPDRWDKVKESIAQALVLLAPIIREKILEIACTMQEESVLLEDVVASLSAEQIAVVLTDYLASRLTRNEADGVLSLNIQTDQERVDGLQSLIEKLIHSPEHFDLLEPLLRDEFQRREMHVESCRTLFEPICGEIFQAAQRTDLAAVSSDKATIFRYATRSDEAHENLSDLLATMNEDSWEASQRTILQELLGREKDPAVYRQILGPRVIRVVKKLQAAGAVKQAREELTLILEHASSPSPEDFLDRAPSARGLLQEMNPTHLVALYLDDYEQNPDFERDASRLAASQLEGVARELIRRSFAPDQVRTRPPKLLSIVSQNMAFLGSYLGDWLSQNPEHANEDVWLVIRHGLCEGCVPVLELALRSEERDTMVQAVEYLGRIGGNRAESLLLSYSRKGGALGNLAFENLCRLSSPKAVSLIGEQLLKPDYLGIHAKKRRVLVQKLKAIQTQDARRLMAHLMTQNVTNLLLRGRHEKRVLDLMQTLRNWPVEEAYPVVDTLTKHSSRRVASLATGLVKEMPSVDQTKASEATGLLESEERVDQR